MEMDSAINTAVGTDIVHGRASIRTDPEAKKSRSVLGWVRVHLNLHDDMTAHFQLTGGVMKFIPIYTKPI